jgi:hypothetical protein
MTTHPIELVRRPEARTESVEDPLLLPGSGMAFEELRSFIRAHGVDHPTIPDVTPDPAASSASDPRGRHRSSAV